MGRLNKIFKGSSHEVSEGQYLGRLKDDKVCDVPSSSVGGHLDFEDEDMDLAIALSLSEEEQWKAKAAGETILEHEQKASGIMGRLNKIFKGSSRKVSEFSMSGNHPYHKSCYKELSHPKCVVCKQFFPTNANGLIECRRHPFWLQNYCPSHETDQTSRCCSCERLEPTDMEYVSLDDGRKLCLECLDSSIMDTTECRPLYLDIQNFYEGLNMKVEQQIPLLLVERQALNEAMEGEKNGHHHTPETRGLCLSEKQTVSSILRPWIGVGNHVIDMITEPRTLTCQCEVTAILILHGLPRLMTGSILAHEMMHAWLRLKGYRTLSPEVEEGICQVLAHMWLDSEIVSGSSSSIASTSSSATPAPSKKGTRSQFEKKLGDFIKNQIESDSSPAYGDGFKAGNKSVLQYGLRRTLDHIRLTGSFPC